MMMKRSRSSFPGDVIYLVQIIQERKKFVLYLFLAALLVLSTEFTSAQCPPVISAFPPGASVCNGDSVTLTCQPSTGNTWQWYRDGAPVLGGTSGVFYAKTGGSYTVKLGSCATTSNPIVVNIKASPYISVSCAPEGPVCEGTQVTVAVTLGPNITWVWLQPNSLFGQNSSPLTMLLYNTTVFQVVGVDQTTTCASSSMLTLEVLPGLHPGILTSDQSICDGSIPSLLVSEPATGSSSNYTYQWQDSIASGSFQDIAGATALTFQPPALTENHWYRIRVSSPPCPDKFSNTIEIKVNPYPSVTSPNTRDICSGDNVSYYPSANVGGCSFTWTSSLISGSVSGFSAGGTGNILDVLSMPPGSVNAGIVTYTITPIGAPPTSCTGNPFVLTVTVQPTPLITNASMNQEICAGEFTNPVAFASNVATAGYSWIATATPGLSGFPYSGYGNLPPMQIFSNLLVVGTVTYTIIPITPSPLSCPGPPKVYSITVNPSPTVLNSPMSQAICSGEPTQPVVLISNVTGTSFTWTATANPSGMSGYLTSGTNSIPVQTILNPGTTEGVITYNILPSGNINGCVGIPRDYHVYVHPIPVAVATPSSQIICSGNSAVISLSSAAAGTSFSWTVSGPGAVTGYYNGNGIAISQLLTNTSNVPLDVIYSITPVLNGCSGSTITATVTVEPIPVLTVNPLNQTSCSGSPFVINLTSGNNPVTFTWTASSSGGVSGFSNGSGPVISQTLTNNDNVAHTVIYAVMMTFNGCTVGPTNIIVTVYPKPILTNTPLSASRCSGEAFVLSLTSNVATANFTYSANGTPGTSGFGGGFGTIINQMLFNNSTSPGLVTYSITPAANGCSGSATNYTVTVNPVPDVSLSMTTQSICSAGSIIPVSLFSSVAGTTFSWNATPSAGGITGFQPNGTGNIPAQLITNSLDIPGNVTYAVTPSFNGCAQFPKSSSLSMRPWRAPQILP